MMPRRGKVAAVTAAALGLAVMAAVAISLKGPILDSLSLWWLRIEMGAESLAVISPSAAHFYGKRVDIPAGENRVSDLLSLLLHRLPPIEWNPVSRLEAVCLTLCMLVVNVFAALFLLPLAAWLSASGFRVAPGAMQAFPPIWATSWFRSEPAAGVPSPSGGRNRQCLWKGRGQIQLVKIASNP